MRSSEANDWWAIVPARAGSRNVPGKNSRVVGGLPLVGWTLNAARQSGLFRETFLSTDDPVLRIWGEQHGYKNLQRTNEVSNDTATIADLTQYLVTLYDLDGVVAVLQPTSPLRTAKSIRAAQRQMIETEADSLMSVSRGHSLTWLIRGKGMRPEPMFEERVNRQIAEDQILVENGAIQFVKSSVLRETGQMIGERHELFLLPAEECSDIDDEQDFLAASAALCKGLVIFRITANQVVGSGHLFQCLQIASQMRHHDVLFILKECDEFARTILSGEGFAHENEDDLDHLLSRWDSVSNKVLVNDILDTSLDDIRIPHSRGFKVVCVEDLGVGASEADWVVNALYRGADLNSSRVSSGPSWTVLRPEFRMGLSCGSPHKGAQLRVLILFGGTDPANLAERFTDLLSPKKWITAQTWPRLNELFPPGQQPSGVPSPNTADLLSAMLSSDVLLTSGGRTVLEAASLGLPTVVVAQNEREDTHAHLENSKGVTYLGLHEKVMDSTVLDTLREMHENPESLQAQSERSKRSLDINGVERVVLGIESLLRDIDFPRHV